MMTEAEKETQLKNDQYKKFQTVCKAEVLTPQFASTCTSAIALLARTVSTGQMLHELFKAISMGEENAPGAAHVDEVGMEMMAHVGDLTAAQLIMLLSRILTTVAFNEYLVRLEGEQKLH